jgi:hypothetical protein
VHDLFFEIATLDGLRALSRARPPANASVFATEIPIATAANPFKDF